MRRRIYYVAMVLSIGFSIVLGKLAYTQLYGGSVYAAQSFQSQSCFIPLNDYARGQIYDRNGRSLLNSYTSPALIVTPQPEEQLGQVYDFLQDYLSETTLSPLQTSQLPFILPLSAQQATNLAQASLPSGVVIVPYHWRYHHPLAIHLIGCLDHSGHGAKGLESYYDALLSAAEPLSSLVYLSDANDRSLSGSSGIRLMTSTQAQPALYLTLDYTIQQTLETCFNQHHIAKGSAIILDIATNDILASVSRPLYDPTDLSQTFGFPDNQLERSLGYDYRYYPGSTFKIATAIAALESHAPALSQSFQCQNTASYQKCPRVHGEVDLRRALQVSCNNYFVYLGESLGAENLRHYLLDTLHFSLESQKDFDSFGAIANGAIGQELIRVSPWQMAQLVSIIAQDGGIWQSNAPWQEQIVSALEQDGQRQPVVSDKSYVQVISTATARTLQNDLASSITLPDGRTLTYAGKTGTPEVASSDEGNRYLAWYVGYAPAENPRYAIAIVIEEIIGIPASELSGGKYALPLFQDLIAQLP